jgi:GTPase
VQAGDGGAGSVSFRREKFVQLGGPDGGDGGQGGNVTLLATDSFSTLQHIRFHRIFKAESGGKGAPARMHGRSGSDLVVKVPIGTLVQRRNADGSLEMIADLDRDGAQAVVAYGGLGGKGNCRFTNSTNQAPHFAERGQKGQTADLVLDLKLLADAGLVGIPSVGKSSLISAVSAARPKVAAYPFTTLEPVLGVVDVGWETFVLVDLPGLIEGAHAGAGLGHEFLRHVERTRVLVHMLDAGRAEALQDFEAINDELRLFNVELATRPQIVALNKIDLPEAQEQLATLTAALRERGIEPSTVSAATGEGVEALMRRVAKLLDDIRGGPVAAEGWTESAGARVKRNTLPAEREEQPPAVSDDDWQIPEETGGGPLTVVRPRPIRRFSVERLEPGLYRVSARRVEAMAEMLNLTHDEARAEFFRRIQRFGIVSALHRAGVENGDRVRFGPVEVTWDFD